MVNPTFFGFLLLDSVVKKEDLVVNLWILAIPAGTAAIVQSTERIFKPQQERSLRQ